MSLHEELKAVIRDVPDFPKPGIMFKDIGPLLRNAKVLQKVVDEFVTFAKKTGAQHIVGIESRGFMFGVPVALQAGLPFIPARKRGKLPGKVVSESYQLEYGVDHIEIQADAILRGERYVIVDDVIATGGTAATVGKLIQNQGGNLVGYSFVIELGFLAGTKVLKDGAPQVQIQSLYTV